MYRSIRINLPPDREESGCTTAFIAPIQQISLIAGRVYNKTVNLIFVCVGLIQMIMRLKSEQMSTRQTKIRKTHEKKGFWLSKGAVQKYLRLKDYPLHSQTVQALVDQYFDMFVRCAHQRFY